MGTLKQTTVDIWEKVNLTKYLYHSNDTNNDNNNNNLKKSW